MNTGTDAKDRFEDRLLAAVLDDFDHLSGATATRSRQYRTGRSIGAQSGRRAIPVLLAGAAAAALAVAGVVVLGPHGTAGVTSAPPGHQAAPVAGVGTRAAPTMTVRQSALYRLASVSATAASPAGRYLVLAETDTETGYPGESRRTTIVDTLTGASTTYQQAYPAAGQAPSQAYTAEPSTLRQGPDATSTEAWYTALPTDPVALRAKLLSLAKQQAAQAAQQLRKQVAKLSPTLRAKKRFDYQPVLSDNDDVYQEAETLLWSPLVEPPLRSALYKVLAATSGFTITTNTTDPAGRPAIAIGEPGTDVTYENPSTGAVLAQVWKDNADVITAVYQTVTSTKTIPPDPYTR